jgi:cytochrome c oxidase subunit 3
MHRINFGALVLVLGLLILILTSFFWFRDICEEASFSGHHTKVVKKGLKAGFILFVISEIMLFFGFF